MDSDRGVTSIVGSGDTQNPYDYGRPVIDHECFAGRLALLREVDYSLGLATAARPLYRHLAITGARGVGKTSLLNQIAYLAGVNGLLAARVELNNELASSQAALFHQILEDIAVRLREHQPLGGMRQRLQRFVSRTSIDVELNVVIGQLKAARKDAADVPQETLRRSLRDCATECRRVGRKAILLCIDEADLLAKDETVLQALRNTFQQQEGFLLVLAGRDDLLQNLGKVFGPMQRFFDQATLGPFENPQEVKDCLEAPLGSTERSIVSPTFASEVHGLTGGRPHLVKLMAFHAYRAMRDAKGSRLRLSPEIVSATLHGAQTYESDEQLKDRLKSRLNEPFEVDEPRVAYEGLVDEVVAEHVEEPEALDSAGDEAPVVKVVNTILVDAARKGATDVLIVPEQNRLRVRMRIDGVMHDVMEVPVKLHSSLVSRIKILAQMDIAERRLPQDGRIRIKTSDGELDCTVSTSPTLHGELVMIGIRSRVGTPAADVALEHSGLSPGDVDRLIQAIKERSGLILVVGNAGSGRTTTMYGLMTRVVSNDGHFVTAEERILRPLPGVVQYQTRVKIGLTIPLLLSKALLQNPDVIMVDSIRDAETATEVVRAATERVVIASMAGRDAVGAVTSLLDMGVDPALLGPALSVVLAQRLVRRPCGVCGGRGNVVGQVCTGCKGSRFKGQLAVFQVLTVDDRLRHVLRSGRGPEEFARVAAESGIVGLRDAALQAVERGETTAEEVARVFV